MNRFLKILTPALCAWAACAAPSLAASPASGLDLPGFDTTVRPQDDLFRAANGTWIKTTEIPADKPEFGAFIQLRDLSDRQVRAIVDELATQAHKPGSVAQKVGAFYASYLDTAAIDKAGLAPVKGLLAEIDAIKTPRQLAQWQGRVQGRLDTPVPLWVDADFKQPTLNRALTWQGGLGLPDRDYYLNQDDERFVKIREAYAGAHPAHAGHALPAKQRRRCEGACRSACWRLKPRMAKPQWDNVVKLRDPRQDLQPHVHLCRAGSRSSRQATTGPRSCRRAGHQPQPDKLNITHPSDVIQPVIDKLSTPTCRWPTWKLYYLAFTALSTRPPRCCRRPSARRALPSAARR